MGKFKAHVDKTIALVKEQKSVGILDLAYELGVSPDYARKVCQVVVAVVSAQTPSESFHVEAKLTLELPQIARK